MYGLLQWRAATAKREEYAADELQINLFFLYVGVSLKRCKPEALWLCFEKFRNVLIVTSRCFPWNVWRGKHRCVSWTRVRFGFVDLANA